MQSLSRSASREKNPLAESLNLSHNTQQNSQAAVGEGHEVEVEAPQVQTVVINDKTFTIGISPEEDEELAELAKIAKREAG